MAELLPLNTYRRMFSLFKTSHFTAPRMYPIARMRLPKYSLLHYAATDGVSLGPHLSDQLLRTIPGIIYIDHAKTFTSRLGSPIKMPGASAELFTTEYRKKNRALRPLKDLVRLEKDDRILPIINYSFLAHMVRYPVTFRAHYYQWYNIYYEVYQTASQLAERTERQQFIELELPDAIPTLTTLKEYLNRQDSEVMKKLRTNEQLIIADLFMWCSRERGKSLLNKIDPANYDKINFIVKRLGSFVVINLGWLNKFRRDPGQVSAMGYEPNLFMLYVLKLINTLHQAAAPIHTETAQEVMDDVVVDEDNVDLDEDIDALNLDLDEDIILDSEELEDAGAIIAALERELEELDHLKDADKGIEVTDEEGTRQEVKTVNTDLLSQMSAGAKEGEAIVQKAEELAGQGLLTSAEYRRLLRVSEVFESLPNPYTGEGTMKEAMEIKEEDLIIKPDVLSEDPIILDKSLTLTTVDVMDRQYIQKVLQKDIIRCVASMQRAPIAITNYTITRDTTAADDREIHSIKITPAVGASSVVNISIPVVKDNGTFRYSGTDYRMRKQRADLPIRKIRNDRVALSSYYSKLFVERSGRSRFNYNKWLVDRIEAMCLNPDEGILSDGVISKVVDYRVNVPMVYSAIATKISSFRIGEMEFWFDHARRIEKFTYSDAALAFEKAGWVLVGRDPRGPLIMDPNGFIYLIQDDDHLVDIGTIESLLDISQGGAPVPMVEINIYSKNLGIGFALGYLLGFEKLVEMLNAKHRRVLAGERMNLSPDEYAIRFKNESFVFKRSDQLATMVLSGFNLYHNQLRTFDSGLFNDKDVYFAIMDREGTGSRYLRELSAINTLFIDPITLDILKWMGEPTTVPELLIRSVEMLLIEMVPSRRADKTKRVELLERVRGYERVAGTVYEVMAKAVRQYIARSGSGRAQVIVNPNEVTGLLIKDPTTAPANNINPIHSQREREVITFGGRGGRSRRAMVASQRLFQEEDRGFVSEATVDSGDVAIITYLSPNSNLTSVRGTVRLFDKKKDGASCQMSSAALLSPIADGDDPKRINFISVQHGHGIAAKGGETQGLRTGMERAIVARQDDEFASTAKADGKVIELSETHLAVEYEDGTVARHQLGLIYTNAEGTLYPNRLLTMLQLGDKVKKFDVLTYNSGFFKPSRLDPNRVDYMVGCVGRVALREATYTVEDSSSISEAFSRRMGTEVGKRKAIRVDFRQTVHDLVRVGQEVDLKTILCTIQDAVSSDAGLYDEMTRETMRRYTAMTPTAKAVGIVEKIEVFYNGDPEDMSESLQIIVAASEKERRRSAKRLGKEYTSGSTNRQVRIEGQNLENDQAVILVYITTPVAMGIGDKLVVGNQGKSTVGEVLFGHNATLEEDEEIDLVFGAKSFIDRVITSPFGIGTTNTVLRFIGEEGYRMYFEE